MSEAVLITGAAQRVGKYIALSLAETGYDIAVHYNESENEAVRLADQIKNMGITCEIFHADLSCPDEAGSLIEQVSDKFANLNVLINNASVFNACSLMDTSYDFLKRNFDINLFSPLLLTREFAKRCRNGQVINILDSNITKNQTSYFPYLMTKKALADFTRQAAVELAPDIRVNGIAPGLVLPGKNETEQAIKKFIKNSPLQEKAETDDIVDSIKFLLTANHVTGQILYVDSGKHLK